MAKQTPLNTVDDIGGEVYDDEETLYSATAPSSVRRKNDPSVVSSPSLAEILHPMNKSSLNLTSMPYDLLGIISFEVYKAMSKRESSLLVSVINGCKEGILNEKELKMVKELSRVDLLRAVGNSSVKVNPTIIDVICYCPFDSIYDATFDDDDRFILISVLIGLNNILFNSSGTGYKFFHTGKTTCCNTTPTTEEVMNVEYKKIKKRYIMMQSAILRLSQDGHYTISLLTRQVMTELQLLLQERLFQCFNKYFPLTTSSPASNTFDVSFLMPSIPSAESFKDISQLIKSGKLTVFSNVRACNRPVYIDNKNEIVKRKIVESRASLLSSLGMKESHFSSRISSFRNQVIRDFEDKLLLPHSSEEESASISNTTECLEEVVDAFSEVKWESQKFTEIIREWPLPKYFCSCLLHKERYLDPSDDKDIEDCVQVFERLLKENEFGEVNMNKNDILRYVKYTISLDQHLSLKNILNYTKTTFGVEDIKYLMRHLLKSPSESSLYSCASAVTLIEEFPWLTKTWIDNEGNTLLGFCIIHSYKGLKNLLKLPCVKDSINTTSRDDDLTPVMILADTISKYNAYALNWLADNGATLEYVNKHNETIFHRAAASDNDWLVHDLYSFHTNTSDKFVKIVDLRRSLDNTTPMMIALSRGNVSFARSLSYLYRVNLHTLFGYSKMLRTPEFILLKGVKNSIEYLKRMRVVPHIGIIRDALLDGTLFEEEYCIADAGLRSVGRTAALFDNLKEGIAIEDVCPTRARGNHVKRKIEEANTWTLLKFPKVLEWIKSFSGTNHCLVIKINHGITTCSLQFHRECWELLKFMTGQEYPDDEYPDDEDDIVLHSIFSRR